MLSNKQKRAQLQQKRAQRRDKQKADVQAALRVESMQRPKQSIAVQRGRLGRYCSYDEPRFVARGWYEDLPFVCRDCGKQEVWTARQQQWWYEEVKGSVWATAVRCRACRLARKGPCPAPASSPEKPVADQTTQR
ncbi:zinc-ribbon domain containing protein [Parachitinimonas caeni]|uniref:Zinc-ribbon domain containing protein n=1 Tax=Parachitinimonas caeni TaxID=3031301 RepID=A0ABT7DWM0_9NEIS|nr:zinc-ribbon domain containing protein [Parachitinimonas caeni]MDK2124379.1 zinc-ribbon domain containing protein [Parachitinimonas caeni]